MPLEVVEYGTMVPLTKIKVEGSAQKVRRETGEKDLEELAESIKKHGQIHAISLLDTGEEWYENINGHRRTLAARRHDIKELRANIYRVPAGQEEQAALLIQQHLYAANMAEPLIPVERARMYDALMKEMEFDVEKVAACFEGETPESVADTLRYLSIDEQVLDIMTANPGKFTAANVAVFADYASTEKHAWKMKPEEQVKIAREIAEQTDKRIANDPRKLEVKMRSVVSERRRAEREKNSITKKGQADPVKALFKGIEGVEAAVKLLGEIDVKAITEIDPSDKGNAIKRVYDAIGSLSAFSDESLAKLRTRKAAVEVAS